MTTRRPRLSLPFTILRDPGAVRLVAGEDFRYTIAGDGVERWLPGLLGQCDGGHEIEGLIGEIEEGHRSHAREVLDRLYGERVLLDGPPAPVSSGVPWQVRLEGQGPVYERLRDPPLTVPLDPGPGPVPGLASASSSPGGHASRERTLVVMSQDRLDYAAALATGRRCRAEGSALLWATTGPMNRALVGPVFLPEAGPCLTCLYRHFHRLSPAPEIYDGLLDHTARGEPIVPIPFPAGGEEVVAGLVRWKIRMLRENPEQSALYRLHVVENDALEVTAYPVFIDPDCPDGHGGGGRMS
ncbi:MAG: TOMM precursor leader peptide-binding protein [Planctomycetes bacterium]|nr:TOMM precursor leader peptide-binding protein [Planctomycetota bacterium]